MEFAGKFATLLSLPDIDTQTMWEEVKKILGSRKANPNKPWITEEVINFANERSKAKQAKLQDPTKKSRYNYLSREIKRKTKGCKGTWIKSLCAKVDKAHQAANSKEVYSTIKTITRKPTIKMQTIKGKDGKILTDLEEVKTRWKENYEELYNKRNPADEETVNSIPPPPPHA